MEEKILWRFLIVDDRQADEVKEFIDENPLLNAPNQVIVETCKNFNDAVELLERLRIDLVILDLKDNTDIRNDDDAPLAGQDVFDEIRKRRFIPVVFNTAYPHKLEIENPYVRIVDRSRPRKLLDAIKDVFGTGLPQLTRFLDSEQKNYMWGQVLEHWKTFEFKYDQIDLTYLLARRLANMLQNDSVRRFTNGDASLQQRKIHPVEMYIYPPASSSYYAGDIFKDIPLSSEQTFPYGIVLTPSCDLEQSKVEQVLIAECKLLHKQPEYEEVEKYWADLKRARDEKTGNQPKETVAKSFKQLLRDNHQSQRERYKFLPGTFFLPDLIIDFQSLFQIPASSLKDLNRIASLDSPFAEACLANFARYYGRIGTPDLDTDFVYDKLSALWEKQLGAQTTEETGKTN